MKHPERLISALVLVFSFINMAAQNLVVKTENGLVSGYKSGEIAIFKGIPFAAPPVGDLRWKAPQPVKSWNGTLTCDKFSASPMQRNPVPFMMWTEEFITPPEKLSEDCLYLNIWTPYKAPNDKLPVFVWIYGGGFSSGSAACAVYDGEEMSEKGIVFISINYRVGVFGFLAHQALSGESDYGTSGNYGLLDQIAALRWIKKNIEAFGGDPEKVTIAGQSAGSMSVCALVSSPLASGLFRGAIAESGGLLGRQNNKLQIAEKNGKAFMEKMKARNIDDLRKMSAEALIAAGGNFGPVADGYVIPENIPDIYNTGKFNDVAFMAGWVTGDAALMGEQKMTPEKYKQQAAERYGEKSGKFLSLFPGADETEIKNSLNEINLLQFAAFPAYLWAGYSKNNAFLYEYSHVPVTKPGFPEYGAFHTSEVPYALHTLHLWNRPWRDIDYSVESYMNEYWVNFVKTGNPNGKGVPEWKTYDNKSCYVMELGDQPSIMKGLYKNDFEFLKEVYTGK